MSRAAQLWRLERRQRAISAALHRLTSEAREGKIAALRLRVGMTEEDRREYEALEWAWLQREGSMAKR